MAKAGVSTPANFKKSFMTNLIYIAKYNAYKKPLLKKSSWKTTPTQSGITHLINLVFSLFK